MQEPSLHRLRRRHTVLVDARVELDFLVFLLQTFCLQYGGLQPQLYCVRFGPPTVCVIALSLRIDVTRRIGKINGISAERPDYLGLKILVLQFAFWIG